MKTIYCRLRKPTEPCSYSSIRLLAGKDSSGSSTTDDDFIKENAQFMFLCDPQKSSVNVCLIKILKGTVTKKVIVCFYNLSEEN